jgi:branched-chain amino acid transport system permease protein
VTYWVDQLLNGLGLVGPIILIAVSLSVVLASLRVLNVAVGSILVVSAMLGIWAAARYGPLAMVVFTIGCAVGASLALELLVLRPQRARVEDPEMGSFAVTLGVSYLITAFANQVSAAQDVVLPNEFPRLGEFLVVDGIDVQTLRVGIFVVSIVLIIAVAWFLQVTSAGMLFRAVASEPHLANSIGIQVNRVAMTSWILSGLLVGVSTIMILMETRAVSAASGQAYLLLPFAAIVAGGLGSLRGTFIAALFFGIAATVVISVTSMPGYQDALIFAVLFLILMVRPAGMFPRVEGERTY